MSEPMRVETLWCRRRVQTTVLKKSIMTTVRLAGRLWGPFPKVDDHRKNYFPDSFISVVL